MACEFLVYLGDCAALSFLQNIQELIQGEQELTDAAKDLSSLSVLEEVESRDSESVLAYSNANLGDLEALVGAFFTSVPIPSCTLLLHSMGQLSMSN